MWRLAARLLTSVLRSDLTTCQIHPLTGEGQPCVDKMPDKRKSRYRGRLRHSLSRVGTFYPLWYRLVAPRSPDTGMENLLAQGAPATGGHFAVTTKDGEKSFNKCEG